MRVLLALFKVAIACALIVGVAVWLADQPGTVRLEWRGVQLESSAGFMALLLLLLCMILWKVGKLFFWAKYGWARRRERRLRLQHEQGLSMLTASFNALAAHDLRSARRAQIAARKQLGDVALVTWLGAQIAERQHDTVTAQKAFLSLTSNPSATNLGWRGLMGAQARLSPGQAQQVMTAALADKRVAKQSYVHEARFSEAARQHNWAELRQAITDAARYRALPKERLNHLEQVLLLERGRALATVEPQQSRLLLERAYRLAPDFLPVLLAYVDSLMAAGDKKLAGKVIATGWLLSPDETLFDRFQKLYADQVALARLQRFERFALKKKRDVQTLLALGQLSLEAELYTKAQAHIAEAQALRPTVRGYDMLADLALASHDDAHQAHSLARQAQDLPADQRYHCTVCDTPYQNWQMLCDRCGAFASIVAK